MNIPTDKKPDNLQSNNGPSAKMPVDKSLTKPPSRSSLDQDDSRQLACKNGPLTISQQLGGVTRRLQSRK